MKQAVLTRRCQSDQEFGGPNYLESHWQDGAGKTLYTQLW